ncbi:MAG: hypothetical protein AB7F75_01345 [Planctomycetota bacterium]
MMERFFQAIFGDAIADERRLSIFTLPGRQARHFASPTAAALWASERVKTKDVYFGVGLAGSNFGRRNASTDIACLGGLWVDLDFAAPHREGKPLPRGLDEGKALLARLPFAPSLLVDSGHGLHAYWLFKEPWILESEEERQKAAQLAKGWHGHVCHMAEGFGWKIENLGDLARVLRPPGTFNRKGPEPVEVRVIEEHPDRRYNPDDFEPYVPAEVLPEAVASGDMVLRADAQPPAEKFSQLMVASPAFAKAWNRLRPDLRDQSQSAYDLSLANIAAIHMWSDQEIANLLIATRVKHGEKLEKALRQDYVSKTIASARAFANDRPTDGVDLRAFEVGHMVEVVDPAEVEEPHVQDPGAIPVELLRVPGFVGELMDHSLETAPYPNSVMAFCGALSMQAFLAGRRVRDDGDNRTNLYILGLAHSASGKDWPRKINVRLAHQVGLLNCLGDRFASGEGLQDAMSVTPGMLFQTDEIDGLLQSISKAPDARHESLLGTLLSLYSASNSAFSMRRRAGQSDPGAIDQPCMTLFGTAIPNHYYEALSERLLTNGLFARMLVFEGGKRPPGQAPRIKEIPQRILNTAKWWEQFRPGDGNMQDWHPVPKIVTYAEQAVGLLNDIRFETDAEYERSEAVKDAVGTAVWGRAGEHIRKLALIWAVSENHKTPEISMEAVTWARALVMHQVRRMLFMASDQVATNPFQEMSAKVLRKLRSAPGGAIHHSVLLKRMKMDARDFSAVMDTLVQTEEVVMELFPRAGSTKRIYRLAGAGGEMSKCEVKHENDVSPYI